VLLLLVAVLYLDLGRVLYRLLVLFQLRVDLLEVLRLVLDVILPVVAYSSLLFKYVKTPIPISSANSSSILKAQVDPEGSSVLLAVIMRTVLLVIPFFISKWCSSPDGTN
jgi:hypothetical protein